MRTTKTDDELLAEANALDALYADATGPAEAYNLDLISLVRAARQLVTVRKRVALTVADWDIKALSDALDQFEPWLEEAGDDPRANGWVDDKGRP